MRWLLLVAFLGGGCLDQLVPAHKASEAKQGATVDMAEAPPNSQDPQQPQQPAGGDDGGSMMPMDDAAAPAGADLAGGSTLAAFGQPCALPTDCQSGICQNITMTLLCTQACTMKGMIDPTCPNAGMCNQNGYCKP